MFVAAGPQRLNKPHTASPQEAWLSAPLCTMPRLCCVAAALVVLLLGAASASAHEGPPFPVASDHPLAGYLVDVWADPDIGEATFYVVLADKDGKDPQVLPSEVTVWVEPVDHRLERVSYKAVKSELKSQTQFEAFPNFDIRDMWNVGVVVTSPSGLTAELTIQVESTPPGFFKGLGDVALYLFPFVLVAVLWLLAMRRRRKCIQAWEAHNRQLAAEEEARSTDPADSDPVSADHSGAETRNSPPLTPNSGD